MSTQELISYTNIKFLTNRFDLCTHKKWCFGYINIGSVNAMWCKECKLYYLIKVKKLWLSINHKQ